MHAMGIRSIALDMGCRIAELNRSQHKEIKLKSAWAGFNEDGTKTMALPSFGSKSQTIPTQDEEKGPTNNVGNMYEQKAGITIIYRK